MKTKIKKKISIACAVLISSYSYSQFYCDSNPVDVHGKLSVSGNRIVDQNQESVSFAGNSMFWSNEFFGAERFYNANVVASLNEDWGATIVRAAMGVEDFGGFLTYPNENRARVRAVVDAAIAEGMYVIIDWHSHHAEEERQAAIDFFREMATLYGDNPNVIYEVYNEPINSNWSNDIKPYAEAVISEIRAIDPDNLIIVGTPFFSQNVDVASNDPITLSTNIAYTLHFYAGTHGASLRSRAQTALNNGIALMVTEWGTVNANGDGGVNESSTNEWMQFLEANDISHLNWSVHDKVEGASILQPGASSNGNWPDSSLTNSGLFVRNIIQNWEQYCDTESNGNTTTEEVVIEPVEIEYVSIPSRIEAEDYVSEFGTQTENTEDIDGVLNVGFIESRDYLDYNIDVPTSRNYTINFRVASRTNGTSLAILSGNNEIGSISSLATGDWQAWETVSTTVFLSEGEQSIRLLATGTGWNINWLEFTEESLNNNVSPIEEEVIPATLTASSLSDFGSERESQIITVSSNIDWRVLKEADWIDVNITSGSNNGSVSVTALANTSTDSRTAVITISGGIGFKQFISVNQKGSTIVVEEELPIIDDNTGSSNCDDISVWNSDDIYSEAGTQVSYNGVIYENKWYTSNQSPEAFSEFSWSLWTVLGPCDTTGAKSLNSDVIGIISFPNPFTSVINISVADTNQVVDSLQLVDLTGRIIAVEKGTSISDLEEVAKGMYLLQVLNANNQVIAIEKVIK